MTVNMTLVKGSARDPESSVTTMTELVLPQHANAVGTAFGGTVMSWIDICAAISAQRHCGGIPVTVAVDDLVFRSPIRVGDIVSIRGRLNAVFRSSMEVEVCVETEDRKSGERTLCVEAYLTFVNLDAQGRPSPVPDLHIEGPEAERRRAQAEARRAHRLRHRA